MPVAEALWVNLNVLLAANKKKMGHKNNTKRLKKCSQCMFEVKKKFHFTKCDRCVAPGSAAEEGCP